MKKQQSKAKKTASNGKKSSAPATKATTKANGISLLDPPELKEIKDVVQDCVGRFKELADNNLNALQRRRKIGAGIRNYGFIDKVSDLAAANPEYAKFFDIQDLKNSIRNIEECRDLLILLQTFARMVSNTMMIYSDDAYNMSLLFYNMVKELSKRGDPGAMEIFKALQSFFKRPKRISAEPTAKEIERDLHSLIKGTKDGKIVVESEKPRIVGGKRLLVDRTRNNKNAFKETEEGEING
jgi:hypothetical protein